MTFQEVIQLTQAGWTKEEIIALSAPTTQQPTQVAPQQAQQPIQVAAQQPTQVAAQPAQQPTRVTPEIVQTNVNTTPVNNLAQQLEDLARALQQPSQSLPPTANVVNQPATTPANAGITPEEATKLFQAWSMGAATQSVELPPTADDVLARRFNSLYGVDTSKETNK